MNLFSYTRNNPVNASDPSGRQTKSPEITIDPTTVTKYSTTTEEPTYIHYPAQTVVPPKRDASAAAPFSYGEQSLSDWLHNQSTGVAFYRPPNGGDYIPTIASNDTGSTALNIPVNFWLGVSNLVAAAINTVGNVENVAAKTAKAVGFSDVEVQGAVDLAAAANMVSLVGDLKLLGEGTAAGSRTSRDLYQLKKSANPIKSDVLRILREIGTDESRATAKLLSRGEVALEFKATDPFGRGREAGSTLVQIG